MTSITLLKQIDSQSTSPANTCAILIGPLILPMSVLPTGYCPYWPCFHLSSWCGSSPPTRWSGYPRWKLYQTRGRKSLPSFPCPLTSSSCPQPFRSLSFSSWVCSSHTMTVGPYQPCSGRGSSQVRILFGTVGSCPGSYAIDFAWTLHCSAGAGSRPGSQSFGKAPPRAGINWRHDAEYGDCLVWRPLSFLWDTSSTLVSAQKNIAAQSFFPFSKKIPQSKWREATPLRLFSKHWSIWTW